MADFGRDDYNANITIADALGILADEPVFLLRGKDPLAGAIVRSWVAARVTRCNDLLDGEALSAASQMKRMEAYYLALAAEPEPVQGA